MVLLFESSGQYAGWAHSTPVYTGAPCEVPLIFPAVGVHVSVSVYILLILKNEEGVDNSQPEGNRHNILSILNALSRKCFSEFS